MQRMIEALSKIIEAVAKYAWGIFILCLFVILLPLDWARAIGLEKIKQDYLGFWWLGLVFSFAIWISSLLSQFRTWFSSNRQKAALKNTVIKRLRYLSPSERNWIAYCLLHNVQTLSATQINETANSLLDKHIVSQGPGSILNLPYRMHDFVWDFLQEHKDHFLPPEVRDDQEKVRILDEFVRSLRESF